MNKKIRLPIEKRIAAILREVQTLTQVPGISIALRAGNEDVALSVGLSSLSEGVALSSISRFEMSCLMKFFVALVTMQLASKKALSLDSPIAYFLPELRDAKASRITLRHLLSHTSGYRGLDITNSQVRWSYSWSQFVEFFAETQQSFEPGSTFNYEHTEHVVLGKILQHVTGRDPYELTNEMIFMPLGIEPGTVAVDKLDPTIFVANHVYSPSAKAFTPVVIPPFGSFWNASLPDRTIAPKDVVKIGAALLFSTRNRKLSNIFSPDIIDWLRTPAIGLPLNIDSCARAERLPQFFSTGCAIYGDVLGHNGSVLGQTCGFRLDLQNEISMAVAVNAWSPQARDTTLRRVMAAILGQEVSSPRRKYSFHLEQFTNGLAPEHLAGKYIGSYLGEVTVTNSGRTMQLDVGAAGNRRRSFKVFPLKSGLYTIESDVPLSAVFFSANGSSTPSLSLGVHSYIKIS